MDRHIVVIGVDGLRYDKIARAKAPRLDAMIASGYTSRTWLYANPMAPTLSGPLRSLDTDGRPDIVAAWHRRIPSVSTRRSARSSAPPRLDPPTPEEWIFIVTTDHGHTDAGGHGGGTPGERGAFIIESGAGISHGTPTVKAKNVDVAAEVLTKFGVTPPAALDGQHLATASTDPFDTLTGSLRQRIDEAGIPADVLGWTHATPSGWTIDNTGLGTGGVTEWRGWSFTNDDFWTKTDPGQQRETNVRARGVFAVADSDEWADKSFSGAFNSRLSSPGYHVQNASTATLRFGSHYRKEGNETASVLVSFDGDTPRNVLTYSGDVVAKIETIDIAVPDGVTSMEITFALTGSDNNWYWAVDNPQVTTR